MQKKYSTNYAFLAEGSAECDELKSHNIDSVFHEVDLVRPPVPPKRLRPTNCVLAADPVYRLAAVG
jgi:hypothetical protein